MAAELAFDGVPQMFDGIHVGAPAGLLYYVGKLLMQQILNHNGSVGSCPVIHDDKTIR